MAELNPAEGLPLLGDPRLHIHLSRVEKQKAVVRLYFSGKYIGKATLDEAKWIFLSELIRAAQDAEGREPELGFLTKDHLLEAVRIRADATFSRDYRTISELRDILTKPLLEKRLCPNLRDGVPLRDRIIERQNGLGYRLGLPAANLSQVILRRDAAHETGDAEPEVIRREIDGEKNR